jgi:predicted anti-sigma-YlaC factor YlaD
VDVPTDDHRQALLTRLLGAAAPEVTCEECFELLDEYVELELAGESAERRLPGMREHLDGCPACREDHESLREFVRLEDAAPE